ncbi:MAG: glycosyltransferase [Eubacterium sp.]|nr:glycosyltransferase [Eubacterium sp.]
MRICISVVTYYPEKNGVQFITQSLAEGLVKNGHEVTVVTKKFREYKADENINGVIVLRCNCNDKNMFHVGNKKEFQDKLISLSRNMDVMLFVNLQSVAADWALDILDSIKCQKILYMHGMHRFKWEKYDYSSFKNFCYKVLRNIRWRIFYSINKNKINSFDKMIHLHEQDDAYKFFEKRYPNKNFVLENFAENIFFTDIDNHSLSDYYIFISNYHPRKNQMLLLKSFYLMKTPFKLIMVGSEKNKYYNKLIQEKNLLDAKYGVKKDIQILYGVDRKKLPMLLKNAYAFVMTSQWEAYPIAIIEAMASGVPILSTDVGIVKYLPGCIIFNDNLVDISRTMDNLIDNKKKYEELKEEAVSYAQNHFIFDNYLAKFEKIIQ